MARRKYGAVSWFERLRTLFILLPLPFVTLSRLLLSPFLSSEKHKTWRRVLADASFRYISSSMRVNEMQSVMGTTRDVYESWAKKNGLEARIDELGDDARLLWFTERRTDKILLYIHGGTYCLPLQDFAATYWKETIANVEKTTGCKVGLVALNYCKVLFSNDKFPTKGQLALIPEAYFPTQLTQLVRAIHHLFQQGIHPSNIHFAGESAGGALVLQLLSHILHPVPNVPPIAAKFGSACIMSPWVSVDGKTGSHLLNSNNDVLPAYTWAYLGEQSAPSFEVPGLGAEGARPYLEALNAPEDWWYGLSGVVKRVFVSVGEYECLRDDVVEVARKLGKEGFVTTVVQTKGVHNDQYLDVMAGEKRPGELTLKITEWLEQNLA
ncbi:hypothetical protein NLJ89_g3105 [Agrocybe chaxingu]|uniref:Alpha/beta hydrolase fold-3 domain-containing protein n=1 Tax=Agrocybe chaxingu TaxID=84603 RepID=A0A9W8K5A3_9AGAR|nr:hypothetical protein NLJ89_g3105 [Agrocybe chaxingu]